MQDDYVFTAERMKIQDLQITVMNLEIEWRKVRNRLTVWRTLNPFMSWPREMVEQGQLATGRLSVAKQRLDAAMDDYVRNNP